MAKGNGKDGWVVHFIDSLHLFCPPEPNPSFICIFNPYQLVLRALSIPYLFPLTLSLSLCFPIRNQYVSVIIYMMDKFSPEYCSKFSANKNAV